MSELKCPVCGRYYISPSTNECTKCHNSLEDVTGKCMKCGSDREDPDGLLCNKCRCDHGS